MRRLVKIVIGLAVVGAIGYGAFLWLWPRAAASSNREQNFDVEVAQMEDLLLVAGVGYSPLIDNVDLHARAILPVTDRVAVQLIAAHNSTNADTRATAGLRFTW